MSTQYYLKYRKGIKSLSSLLHYMYRCPIITGKKIGVVRNILAKTSQYLSKLNSNKQTNNNWIGLNEITV